MIPDLRFAIHLQSLDQQIAELEREIAALPKHIAEIERQLDQHIRRLEADRAALSGNQKERKRIEGEVQIQQQKISKLRDQMLEAKTNEQYRAFQHEIDYCNQEVRKHEDRILDLMSESEALEKNVRAAEAGLKTEKEQVEREKQDARKRAADGQRQLDACRSDRSRSVAGMTPAVYRAYERIRKKRNGVAVAEVVDGLCLACNLALRPQFYQDVRKNEQILYCESCGRIMYFNPPVVVDEAATPPTVLS
jgi:predicted  nucleic acid-binding Zn-ribbon protein